jgi:hypothetical protein
MVLINPPIINPGIKNIIGKKTGPGWMLKIVTFGDTIKPTVTKYAQKTKGK